jgi:hypothetical protein
MECYAAAELRAMTTKQIMAIGGNMATKRCSRMEATGPSQKNQADGPATRAGQASAVARPGQHGTPGRKPLFGN